MIQMPSSQRIPELTVKDSQGTQDTTPLNEDQILILTQTPRRGSENIYSKEFIELS